MADFNGYALAQDLVSVANAKKNLRTAMINKGFDMAGVEFVDYANLIRGFYVAAPEPVPEPEPEPTPIPDSFVLYNRHAQNGGIPANYELLARTLDDIVDWYTTPEGQIDLLLMSSLQTIAGKDTISIPSSLEEIANCSLEILTSRFEERLETSPARIARFAGLVWTAVFTLRYTNQWGGVDPTIYTVATGFSKITHDGTNWGPPQMANAFDWEPFKSMPSSEFKSISTWRMIKVPWKLEPVPEPEPNPIISIVNEAYEFDTEYNLNPASGLEPADITYYSVVNPDRGNTRQVFMRLPTSLDPSQGNIEAAIYSPFGFNDATTVENGSFIVPEGWGVFWVKITTSVRNTDYSYPVTFSHTSFDVGTGTDLANLIGTGGEIWIPQHLHSTASGIVFNGHQSEAIFPLGRLITIGEKIYTLMDLMYNGSMNYLYKEGVHDPYIRHDIENNANSSRHPNFYGNPKINLKLDFNFAHSLDKNTATTVNFGQYSSSGISIKEGTVVGIEYYASETHNFDYDTPLCTISNLQNAVLITAQRENDDIVSLEFLITGNSASFVINSLVLTSLRPRIEHSESEMSGTPWWGAYSGAGKLLLTTYEECVEAALEFFTRMYGGAFPTNVRQVPTIGHYYYTLNDYNQSNPPPSIFYITVSGTLDHSDPESYGLFEMTQTFNFTQFKKH